MPADDSSEANAAPDDEATAIAGVAGTEDGVFAGSEGVAPCVPDELTAALTPGAPETVAWAEIQQIGIESVPTFIDELTSAVLSADTRITDHELVVQNKLQQTADWKEGVKAMSERRDPNFSGS